MNLLTPIHETCPYCGEAMVLLIDTSVTTQTYIEDCEVCCRPMTVSVSIDEEANIQVNVKSENEV